MTTLTGRPGNYVRIPESQYKADIAAAEERGRAAASQTAPSTSGTPVATPAPEHSEPTKEQNDAMAEVKALQTEYAAHTADDPNVIAAKLTAHIAEQKKSGRRIGYAQAAAEIQAKK